MPPAAVAPPWTRALHQALGPSFSPEATPPPPQHTHIIRPSRQIISCSTDAPTAAACRLVVAIDPAPLHPLASSIPHLRHLQQRTQHCLPDVIALLQPHGGRARVITCDMNQHPASAWQALLPLLPLLQPGGLLVFTLKFFGRNIEQAALQRVVLEAEAEGLCGVRVLHLLCNTECERTVVAFKGRQEKVQRE
jgi:hypothetical protein